MEALLKLIVGLDPATSAAAVQMAWAYAAMVAAKSFATATAFIGIAWIILRGVKWCNKEAK